MNKSNHTPSTCIDGTCCLVCCPAFHVGRAEYELGRAAACVSDLAESGEGWRTGTVARMEKEIKKPMLLIYPLPRLVNAGRASVKTKDIPSWLRPYRAATPGFGNHFVAPIAAHRSALEHLRGGGGSAFPIHLGRWGAPGNAWGWGRPLVTCR